MSYFTPAEFVKVNGEWERTMRTYQAFYRGREITVEAESSYAAQSKAAQEFRARRSWEVTVVLADVTVDTATL